MNKFWRYLSQTIIHPAKTFKQLLADPHYLRYGTQVVFLIAILYTFTVIGLALNHASVATPPVVTIPAEHYYFWQSFFTLPVFVLAWILAAGLAHLLSKFFRGSGTFEGTAAVLGFALSLPGFVTWSVETVITVLTLVGLMHQGAWTELTSHQGLWQVFAYVYQLVALGWYLVLFPIAVGVAQQLRWWQALIVGLFTFSVVGSIVFLFIR